MLSFLEALKENTRKDDPEFSEHIQKMIDELKNEEKIKITIEGWDDERDGGSLEGVSEFMLFARVKGGLAVKGAASKSFRLIALKELAKTL